MRRFKSAERSLSAGTLAIIETAIVLLVQSKTLYYGLL